MADVTGDRPVAPAGLPAGTDVDDGVVVAFEPLRDRRRTAAAVRGRATSTDFWRTAGEDPAA